MQSIVTIGGAINSMRNHPFITDRGRLAPGFPDHRHWLSLLYHPFVFANNDQPHTQETVPEIQHLP